MTLGDDDLRLLCVIEGETEMFPIDIKGPSWRNPKFMVADLKEEIQKEQKAGSLAGVDAHSLILWKTKEGNPVDVKPKQTRPERVASYTRESGRELYSTEKRLKRLSTSTSPRSFTCYCTE